MYFQKVRATSADIKLKDAPGLATKAMNDITGPKGLVPSFLVFGVMPRILLAGFDQLPGQVQRLKAMQAARKDMSKEIAQNCLTTALKSKVPAAAHHEIGIGSEVFVYKDPPLNK